MKKIVLIFPHQLFDIKKHPFFTHEFEKENNIDEIHIIEEALFFGDPNTKIPFHKSKLVFHRASMRAYYDELKKSFPKKVITYNSYSAKTIGDTLKKIGIKNNFYIIDPTDYLLEKRIRRILPDITFTESPMFLNSKKDNKEFCTGKEKFIMHHFYMFQRRRLNILINEDATPVGGQWSFDQENRKKIPKKSLNDIPSVPVVNKNTYIIEAKEWVEKNMPDNPGDTDSFWYPVTHDEAQKWFEDFLQKRFNLFGDYEDALVSGENILYHSVLSPLLNTGLLDVRDVVSQAITFAEQNLIPLNSLEGFVRQIIGWREYIRMQYEKNGTAMRTSNYWNHSKKLPKAFWSGTTSIPVVDEVVHKITSTGYLHHIERLMIVGNIMFLLEIDPDEIYHWFMSLSIDSYDWVMVTNVYGMSQHAAGNLITTKPYMSGSNYVKKMSNFEVGDWCETWDALYWNFVITHQSKLSKNHRMHMITSRVEKFTDEKKKDYKAKTEAFSQSLWTE